VKSEALLVGADVEHRIFFPGSKQPDAEQRRTGKKKSKPTCKLPNSTVWVASGFPSESFQPAPALRY
jgi:hypothetical protein